MPKVQSRACRATPGSVLASSCSRGFAGWRALHGGSPAVELCRGVFRARRVRLVLALRDLVIRPGSRPGSGARSVVWQLAADHLRQSIHRNAVTVAALAAAIAMIIGLMVMIFSFRDERGCVDPSRHCRRSFHRARVQ